jgi:cob(I)alamin adenosyltransferase
MTRIYTKTGDDGTTGLIGGARLPKDAARIEAYGSLDELNAVLGMVRAHSLPVGVDDVLQSIQDQLFTVGANLALPGGGGGETWGIPGIGDKDIEKLEHEIDACETRLQPLTQFVLPGGTHPGALLHLARTVSRRAERRCVTLARAETVDARIIRYLNRLSDYCFVLARLVNQAGQQKEMHPTFGKS